MKQIIAFVFAIGTLALASSDAFAWTCNAQSRSGYTGWSRDPDMRTARRMAMRECRRNDPRRREHCHITSCSWL